MQRVVQVPSALITALNGLVVVFVVSSEFFRKRSQKRRLSQSGTEQPKPEDAEMQQEAGEA
jgi:simple sugar transport system permease protein